MPMSDEDKLALSGKIKDVTITLGQKKAVLDAANEFARNAAREQQESIDMLKSLNEKMAVD